MFRFVLAATLAFGVTPGAHAGGAVVDEACHLDGFEAPLRCVAFDVPLDYDAPQGATVRIAAAVAPALSARPAADPLFVLAGGPGQAGTGMAAWLATAFGPTRRARDVVLVDFRGTGRAGPLQCDLPLDDHVTPYAQLMRRAAADCYRTVGERARFYTHREVVEDLEALRRTLGYRAINLWGGSFGTRAAQHYLRKYGENVRSAVLDGATPVAQSIFATAPRTGQAALERLFDDCARDAACRAAFPSLAANVDDLLRKAQAGELAGQVPHARNGRAARVLLDRDAAVNIVRGALYADFSRAVLPFAVTAALDSDLAPLLALGAATGEWSTDTMAFGFTLSIVCSEDAVQTALAGGDGSAAGFVGDSYYRAFAGACAEWPVRPLPREMLEPIESAVPALVISGAADPVTPPQLGAATLEQFRKGVHALLPHGFHTNSANPCVAGVIAAFLADPSAGGRDLECLERSSPRPRFYVGSAAEEGAR